MISDSAFSAFPVHFLLDGNLPWCLLRAAQMNVTLCVVRSSSKNLHIHFPSSASASEIR